MVALSRRRSHNDCHGADATTVARTLAPEDLRSRESEDAVLAPQLLGRLLAGCEVALVLFARKLLSWPTTAPWVRPDGFVVAEGMQELIAGRIRVPILLTPDGSRIGSPQYASTGTWGNGTPASECAVGLVTSVSAWSLYTFNTNQCTITSYPLLCFER